MNPKPTEILFIDIETVASMEKFADLDERTQKVFLKKFNHTRKEVPSPDEIITTDKGKEFIKSTSEHLETDQELWIRNAALYAEYNTVIVVCVGIIQQLDSSAPMSLYIKTITNKNEQQLLLELFTIFAKYPNHWICGHNSSNFDFPVLGRKFLLGKIKLPPVLNMANIKTWDMKWIDTVRLWGMGEWKANISLDSMACAFNLPSPKTILADKSVHELFYEPIDKKAFAKAVADQEKIQKKLPYDELNPTVEEIVKEKFKEERLKLLGEYCAGDVKTDVQLYLLLNGMEPIPETLIKFV